MIIVFLIVLIDKYYFSCFYRTTPWVISSEIFPVETRGKSQSNTTAVTDVLHSNPSIMTGLNVALSTAIFWTSAAVSTQVIPVIIDSTHGIFGYMCLLLGITFAAFLLVLLGIPETKVTWNLMYHVSLLVYWGEKF